MAHRFARIMTAATLVAAVVISAAAARPAATPASPKLMIVSVSHFDNPGRDINNVKVDDVLTPERQREIAAVVDRLATFRPTRVAVEWPADEQAKLDRRYADYRAGRYTLTRDERDQIGLRLAAKLGLARVDAVDWNDEPPGKDADYDFVAWMQAHGRGAAWDRFRAGGQKTADETAAWQRCHAIGDWLRRLADPAVRATFDRSYYDIARMGDGASNPGAAWVGAWHARNLRILNNLRAIGEVPGARVLAVYGAGHTSFLEQYARESGAFAIVDPRPYLPTAPARC